MQAGCPLHQLLVIRANPKRVEDSFSLQLTEAFLESYKASHPDVPIRELNLYEMNLGHLGPKEVEDMRQGKLSEAVSLARVFAAHNRFVIAAPVWNLGIPSILKAYFDYVCQPGITFRYTPNGATGNLKGAKAVFLTSRGGIRREERPYDDLDMATDYVRSIMNLVGVRQFDSLAMEGTGVDYAPAMIEKFTALKEQARLLAEQF